MLTRLKQHLKDQLYWSDCIVVVSKDNLLNKAHVKFLENKFYGLAKTAGRSVAETYNEIGAKIDNLELKNNLKFAQRSKFLKMMDKLFYKGVL